MSTWPITGNHRVRKIDTTGTINTVAGKGDVQFSGDGGPAVAAGIDPVDVALDSAGNLLVVDQSNSRIRKITPAGTITTVVGNGLPGYGGDGGPATAAMLDIPVGIALDHSGNMYISDVGNKRVRRVTTGGLITTIAGNGKLTPSTGDDEPASAAQLNPFGIAVDAAGERFRIGLLERSGAVVDSRSCETGSHERCERRRAERHSGK